MLSAPDSGISVNSGWTSIRWLSVMLVYQEACAAQVERFEGHITKYLGDGKEEVINAERMLLYVAATRAKKWLLVTSSGKPSKILEPQATAE